MLFLSRWDDQGRSADPDRLMLNQRWVSGWACKSAQMCLVIGGFGHISLIQRQGIHSTPESHQLTSNFFSIVEGGICLEGRFNYSVDSVI